MKLLSAEIKGLIGLERGSGLRHIKIDFTKCKHKIILITGANGSGKTSLKSVLHPLPDSQSMYIAGEEGYKKLSYICNGIIYDLSIIYPVNRNGERTTTKAYITKINDGVRMELNQNGNVTSYKEYLFTEFKLDSNFMALTSLSIEDKGIVEKTPAERKKYVGSIVSTVEVYNNIYKALNKRSSIFKSMINTLVSKIDSIGDKDNLESTLKSMDLRIDKLSKDRDVLLKKLSGAETVVQNIDPNNEIQQKYNEMYNQLTSINVQIETLNLFISKYMKDPYQVYISDQKTCSESNIAIDKDISILQSKLDSVKDTLQNLLKEREEDSKTLNIKVNKMESLRSRYNFDELFKQLRSTQERIETFKSILNELGLTEDTTLTKDEFILGLNTLKNIKDQVNTFRSFSYDHHINKAIKMGPSNVQGQLNRAIADMDEVKFSISDLKRERVQYEILLDKTKILKKRPGKCRISYCPFIEDALKANDQKPAVKLDEIDRQLSSLEKQLLQLDARVKELSSIYEVTTHIDRILSMISNNKSILDKLPNGNIFTDTKAFLNRLSNGDSFDDIRDLYKYIDYANLFETYRIDKENLIKLESEYQIYKNRSDIIDEIQSDIETLKSKLDTILEDIEKYNSIIFDLESQIQSKSDIYQIVAGIKVKYDELEKLTNDKSILEDGIKSMAINMKAIEQAIQDINNINTQITNLDNELKPIKEDKDSIKYSLKRLEEYTQELAIYNAKYNKIEIIKKYSTPTKDGIQNLFIEVYMGQTIAMANELLSMFFGGKLRLGKYIINENEFRIPCISAESNLPNDDISSCSGGERSMIGMILSCSLLQQSSTLYNVLRLDEIDGTLDQSNRAMFIEVLETVIEMLKIETCLMVSHSSEASLDNVDVIALRYDNESYNRRGNIIYSI